MRQCQSRREAGLKTLSGLVLLPSRAIHRRRPRLLHRSPFPLKRRAPWRMPAPEWQRTQLWKSHRALLARRRPKTIQKKLRQLATPMISSKSGVRNGAMTATAGRTGHGGIAKVPDRGQQRLQAPVREQATVMAATETITGAMRRGRLGAIALLRSRVRRAKPLPARKLVAVVSAGRAEIATRAAIVLMAGETAGATAPNGRTAGRIIASRVAVSVSNRVSSRQVRRVVLMAALPTPRLLHSSR